MFLRLETGRRFYCNKDRIEELLFSRRRNLFTQLDMVFFDTTSTCCEGSGSQSIGQYGNSKDHRPKDGDTVFFPYVQAIMVRFVIIFARSALALTPQKKEYCLLHLPSFSHTGSISTILPVLADSSRARAVTALSKPSSPPHFGGCPAVMLKCSSFMM